MARKRAEAQELALQDAAANAGRVAGADVGAVQRAAEQANKQVADESIARDA